MAFNRVLISGNLVSEPELRVMPSGTQFCRIRIASSRSFHSDKAEGGVREETVFVDVEVFGKRAETVAKFFNKGRPIFVEGRLRQNEWTNKDGEKRHNLVIVMDNFEFMGSNPGRSAENTANVDMDRIDKGADLDEDVPF
jgi:single-strand DNA-binding protein